MTKEKSSSYAKEKCKSSLAAYQSNRNSKQLGSVEEFNQRKASLVSGGAGIDEVMSGGEESIGSPRIRPATTTAGGRGKVIINESIHKVTPN